MLPRAALQEQHGKVMHMKGRGVDNTVTEITCEETFGKLHALATSYMAAMQLAIKLEEKEMETVRERKSIPSRSQWNASSLLHPFHLRQTLFQTDSAYLYE